MAILGPLDPFRAFSALRSGVTGLLRAAQADHATIAQRSLRSYSSVMTHAFLHAAVAPSRRIRPVAADDLVEHAALLRGRARPPDGAGTSLTPKSSAS
jgi:hypothetical protein